MQLAKNVIDIGLSTNNLEPMLRFWQQDVAVRFDHVLVDGRRADAEMALDVGFGGRLSEHVRIGMDESEVMPLLLGEARA